MGNRPERPELEATYLGIALIFENLDSCRATLKRIDKALGDPSDALFYRDTLAALVRLEAQVDALTHCFQKDRETLRQWLRDMEAYYKKLEAHIEKNHKKRRPSASKRKEGRA